MKTILVIGVILSISGFITLVYFVSPVRFLMQAYVPHPLDLTISIAGGFSLACGIALLSFIKVRSLNHETTALGGG